MNTQTLHPSGAFDRDRDIDDNPQNRAVQQADAMAHRDRDQSDRQNREPYPATTPHHSSAGSLPIHQPVASRIPGAIHSPGGLLANHGSAAPPIPLGAPAGPVATFGGPLLNETNRPIQHQPAQTNQPSQHQMFGPLPHTSVPPSNSLGASSGPPNVFGGPLQQQDSIRPSAQQAQLGGNLYPAQGDRGATHGQQPILNVSKSFLGISRVCHLAIFSSCFNIP
jgi:paired amphipathic helix protein Sin3a